MISVEIKGVELRFETDPSNFSPNHIDTGTRAMLSAMEFREEDKVLDLGCGYGVVGILAGRLIGCEKVILCDVSERAVTQARLNAERNGLPDLDIRRSDGFSHIPEKDFTLILSNPPYHTDFSVAKRFIESGFQRLVSGGRLVMVTKRLDWYKNKLISVFGGVMCLQRKNAVIRFGKKRRGRPRFPKSCSGSSGKEPALRPCSRKTGRRDFRLGFEKAFDKINQ